LPVNGSGNSPRIARAYVNIARNWACHTRHRRVILELPASQPTESDIQEVGGGHLGLDSKEHLARAAAAYQLLQRDFFVPDLKLFREAVPPVNSNAYSYLWPFSQMMAATHALAEIPLMGGRYRADANDRLHGLEWYWDGDLVPPCYASYVRPPVGHGGDYYYDDNAWVGLELVRLHDITGHPMALSRARSTFDFVVSGWDTDTTRPAPGGVFWVATGWNTDRNTVSTAPGAMLGLLLYEKTGEPRFLEWGRRMYDWTNRHMLAPNGLYWDKIDAKGTIDRTHYSYNQGAMIGAGIVLSRITGETVHFRRAETTADAAVAYFADRIDGRHSPAFDAIFFRMLSLLDQARGTSTYLEPMVAYAQRLAAVMRELDGPVTLLDQSAMVQLDSYVAGYAVV
jgi:uncharacterized protein YyaL (SSP411 family)